MRWLLALALLQDIDDGRAAPEATRAPPWRAPLAVFVVGAVICACVYARRHPVTVSHWLKGESDIAGRRRYSPPYPADPSALAALDFEAVHARLLPRWVAAVGQEAPGASPRASAGAFRALRDEAGKDRNLDGLLVELSGLVGSRPDRQAARIEYLCWAWNDYLDRLRVPYRIEGRVGEFTDGFRFYLRSYRVVRDAWLPVGGEPYRARLMTRADRVGWKESYLGHASQLREGALVLIDRVRELAVDRVWPVLDGGDEIALTNEQRAFAGALRGAARAGLSVEHLRTLERAAPLRREIAAMVAAAEAHPVCVALPIGSVPFAGISAREHAMLRALAAAGGPCAAVHAGEAEALIDVSERLAAIPDLEPAVGALVAWMARGVAVHEIRHVADDARAQAFDRPLACPACPASMGILDRLELSAYLASFAAPATGVASLYQACEVAGGGGDGDAALAFVLPLLLPAGCGGGPPEDLAARAATLERESLGRSNPIAIPEGFPLELAAR